MTGPRTSPDGTVEVRFHEVEVWHHTVDEPTIHRARDGRLVVDLRGTMLDAKGSVTFPGPHRVRLVLRRYPHGSVVRHDLVVDVEAESFAVGGDDPDRPLAELPDVVRELRAATPHILAADLAAARCPDCGGHLRRAGVSAFDTSQPFECSACGRVW